ncbi:MAG: type II toxin-antitoxin system RelE/ParE family toxin [Syntrophobacteraceae bacterium]
MALPIRWSPKAARQTEAIIEYIAEDSPRYAAIFAKRVTHAVRAIPANPRLGRMVPEYLDPDLREKILQGYRIVYRISHRAIEVVTVCHGSRLVQNAIEEPGE